MRSGTVHQSRAVDQRMFFQRLIDTFSVKRIERLCTDLQRSIIGVFQGFEVFLTCGQPIAHRATIERRAARQADT